MNIFSLPPFLTSLFISWLGIIVYGKKKDSLSNKTFSLVCFFAAIWLFFSALAYSCTSETTAYTLLQIAYFGVINLPITIFYFIALFLNLNFLKRFIFILYIAGFFFEFQLLFTHSLLSGVHRYFWGYYPVAGKFYIA